MHEMQYVRCSAESLDFDTTIMMLIGAILHYMFLPCINLCMHLPALVLIIENTSQ